MKLFQGSCVTLRILNSVVHPPNTGQLLLELLDHKDVIRDIKFAPDGSMRLVSGSRDAKLKVWNMHDDGNMMKTLSAGSKWIYACVWSPDAKMLCSVGDNRMVSRN